MLPLLYQVEVLEGTLSGERKVKVMQLTVSTMWDATAELIRLGGGGLDLKPEVRSGLR